MTAETETDVPEVTPEVAYENIWKPIVEEEGVVNMDAVKSLLFDYGALLHGNAILFPYLTEGQIEHPQTDIEEVIQVADDCVAVTIDDSIRLVLNELLDTLKETDKYKPKRQLEELVDKINVLYERGNQ